MSSDPEPGNVAEVSVAEAPASRARSLRCVVALSGLALVGATWRLWTPQHVFPQVPVFRWVGGLPDGWQWILLAGMVSSLLAALLAPKASRLGSQAMLAFALFAAGLIAGDQHRMQPWAYHLMLTALALATLPPRDSWPLLRLLTASIYFYSGWSKCDLTFIGTLGEQFVDALFGLVGLSTDAWPLVVRRMLAGCFPLGELLIAAALVWPRSRRSGLWAAVASHLLLLLILGPWGLRHRPAVLLWNLSFIAQDLLLFGRPCGRTDRWLSWLGLGPKPDSPDGARAAALDSRLSWPGRACAALVWLAILAPLSEAWGFCDHRPAWSLYAPRVERVHTLVRRGADGHLPDELRQQLVPLKDDDDWLELRADRWSLAALDAPIYPQNRFQLAVAVAVGEQCQLGRAVSCVCDDTADRWTGKRQRRTLVGLPAIKAAGDEYWLNARPR